jgi:hypothetical protein
MEGTCGPDEEEVVQREMVGEFTRLDCTKQVELGRKVIKNHCNHVRNRLRSQQATVEIPTREEGAGKCKGAAREAGGARKAPRMRAQTAEAENVASTSTGAKTNGHAGVEVATQASDTDGGSWVNLAQELHRVNMRMLQTQTEMAVTAKQVCDQYMHSQNELYQEQESVHAMQRMIQWCQGAWASVRESFDQMGEAVGGTLYLTGNEDSASGTDSD